MKGIIGVAALAAALAAVPAANAADRVRLIVSQKEAFELFPAEIAVQDGMFKEQDLDVSLLYGDGGGNSLQAILTASSDVIIGVGTLSIISAYAKGGAVTVIGNYRMGAGDAYWYVPMNSPIKTIKDIEGKTIAYSRPGSSSHLTLTFVLAEHKVNAKPTSAGSFAASRTQVMSGQLDVAHAATPAGLDMVRKGETRIIFTGREAKGLADHSIRVAAANSDWLGKNRPVAERFMRAMWKATVAYYKGGEPMFQRFANHWKLDIQDARRGPEFTALGEVAFAPLGNIAGEAKLALQYDFIKEPLTEAQLKKLVDVVYAPPPVR
jgi:NitT/TauT family transport system substrate-binding protein